MSSHSAEPGDLEVDDVSAAFEADALVAVLALVSLPTGAAAAVFEAVLALVFLMEEPAALLLDALAVSRGTCLASSMRRFNLQICGSSSDR